MTKSDTKHDADNIQQSFREFAYGVSHDLSAPVRAMVSFSELLGEEYGDHLPEDAKEYLEIILDNGKKLQKMMDGLLAYSRLNTMGKNLVETDCNSVLKNCLMVLQPQLQKNGGTIDIAPLPTLYADTDQITQLFMILLENAIHYHAPGNVPMISVTAQEDTDLWRFCVSDNGIGMETKHLDYIFKPFGRLHTDTEYPGIGMGLALAQKIVHRHDGDMNCESVPGQGSRFYFTLPKAKK